VNGDLLIAWTARAAVACYVGRVAIDAAGRCDPAAQKTVRWIWTLGCIIFLAHVAAAFHFVHGWSHAAAYEHVARRTNEMIGWTTGVGLYVNYAFTLVWLVDCVLWWRCLDWPKRRVPYWIIQLLFGFLMMQATMVFGPPFWKPVGLVTIAGLLMLFWYGWRRRIARHKSIPSSSIFR